MKSHKATLAIAIAIGMLVSSVGGVTAQDEADLEQNTAAVAAEDYKCRPFPRITAIAQDIKLSIETMLGRTMEGAVIVCDADALPVDFGSDRTRGFVQWFGPSQDFGTNELSRCEIWAPLGWEHGWLGQQVFECYAIDLVSLDSMGLLPAWLREGAGTWVATTVQPDWDVAQEAWTTWLSDPQKDLRAREDDAIGFFVLMEDSGMPLGRIMRYMLELAVNPDAGEDEAYQAAASEGLLNEWGPGYFGETDKADQWYFEGESFTSAGRVVSDSLEVASGSQIALSVAPYAAATYEVDLQADIVAFGTPTGSMGLAWKTQADAREETTDGLGLVAIASAHMLFVDEFAIQGQKVEDLLPYGWVRMPDGQELRLQQAAGVSFCTLPESSCECPDGSPGESLPVTLTAPGVAQVGMAGHLTGSDHVLTGWSLDEFCNVGEPADSGEDIQRYVLAGGSWSYEVPAQSDNRGCSWPGWAWDGTFSYDPNAFDQEIEFRSDEEGGLVYRADVSTAHELASVIVPACEGYHSGTDDHVPSAIINWMTRGFDTGWYPVTGGTIEGLYTWGDSLNVSSWTIGRTERQTEE